MSKDVFKLFIELIEHPLVPKPYKELSVFYQDKNMLEEAEAFLAVANEFVSNDSNPDSDAQQ